MNIRSFFEKGSKQVIEAVNASTNRLTIQEQANQFFENILGLEEIKENLYRNLKAEDQINTLLVGPPATSKSVFMQTIRDNYANVIYFDAASGGTGAGLIQVLNTHRTAKVLIIDEIDKLKKTDASVLLGLLAEGLVQKSLKSESISFTMKGLKVFATSNSTAKLSKPLKSRFEIYQLPEYTDEQFTEVVKHCLRKNINEDVAGTLAQVFIAHSRKDVREVINLARKIRKEDTEEDVIRVVENKLKFSPSNNEDVDYN